MSIKLRFMNGLNEQKTQEKTTIFSISLRDFRDPQQLHDAISLANERFLRCDIALCDSLQRYNFIWQRNLLPEKAHAAANQAGEDWIHWFDTAYQGSAKARPQVIRWDDWLNHPEFQSHLILVEEMYAQDPLLKKMIEESTRRYLTRLAQRTKFDLAQAQSLSIDFVKEEVAILALQAKLGYDFEIFLEKRNPALQYFFEQVIWRQNPLNLQPVLIKILL